MKLLTNLTLNYINYLHLNKYGIKNLHPSTKILLYKRPVTLNVDIILKFFQKYPYLRKSIIALSKNNKKHIFPKNMKLSIAPNRLIVLFRFINLLKKSNSECMQIACHFLILKLVPFDILNVITI